MKKYTVKQDENLGSIARKFWLPSWKYLYELNKDVIGDNPDLLKPGTKLQIPQWDTTSGDEKIKEKGAESFLYTGGLSYRYPWEPVSFTLANSDGTVYREKDDKGNGKKEFEKKKKYEIRDKITGTVLASGEIGSSEELSVLAPDVKNKILFIDGEEYRIWNGVEY